MGKTHVFGFATALKVFDLPFDIELRTVADVTEAAAQRAAAEFGFARATSDWREIILDPEIEIVDITAPNALHEEMALTAIGAGKHVYCEKPVATRSAGARRMAAAAETAGIRTQVGFNYLCNPMFACAREMIQSGELGEIRGYRGLHCEDYMADAASPFTFRHDPEGGGALADLGSHALASAEFLLGPISKVMGDCVIAILERPVTTGGTRPVTVDDTTRVFLRFENGATGSIEANWVATGREMQHDFEIWGTRGALSFSQERLNELHWYLVDDRPGRQGFRRIEAGPDHPPYGKFCVAPAHQLGFNDLKAIEVAGFVRAIAGEIEEPFGFRAGLRIQTLVETIARSSAEGRWLEVTLERTV